MGKRVQQRQVLALLLALGALTIPVAGAILYSGTAPGGSFAFMGSVSLYDFLPVLMLVGALGLLVVLTGGDAPRTGVAAATAVVVVLAAGVLALGYFGAAYQLRPGGMFSFSADGQRAGWTFSRIAVVGSMVVTGALCTWVLVLAGTWMTDRPTGATR